MAVAGGIAAAIAALVAAGAQTYSSANAADAAAKGASAAGVGKGGGMQGYQPTAIGAQGGAGQTVRQALGFDAQRRDVGANSPTAAIPPAKGFSAGGAPPATIPEAAPAMQAPMQGPLSQIPQGRSFNDMYNQTPTPDLNKPNIPGGEGGDLYHSQIGQNLALPQDQSQQSTAGQYGQYAQLAASLGQMFRPQFGGGAGIPHPGSTNYTPTAGQFARRQTY